MHPDPAVKYRPFPPVALPDRQWPNRTQTTAPQWCSVDLRDGNQALPQPMSVAEKLELFRLLKNQIGFREIEIGFPSAADTEFAFARRLIDDGELDDTVTVQALVQCREHLITRTVEALDGAPRSIVHFYNSTNPLQRRVTFGMTKAQIKQIAVEGATLVRDLTKPLMARQDVRFQYSPESFSDTELEFSLEVCEAVMDVLEPTPENPLILNLPATVELFTPNLHADQIEWFIRHMQRPDCAIISLHTHNDRGTGVAATELAMLAGAQRVEGTLFGNGERTGNLDIVTVALNLYTQGIHPGLDFSRLPEVREVYERTTRMTVHERHPYGGDLVFTAFSGSHQDAIKKGMDIQAVKAEVASAAEPQFRFLNEVRQGAATDETESTHGKLKAMLRGVLPPDDLARWEVPYLPIDPSDIGRAYEPIVRINSQSGKGGLAYVLLDTFGYELPKAMHPEVGAFFTQLADASGSELSEADIHDRFREAYVNREDPLKLIRYDPGQIVKEDTGVRLTIDVALDGETKTISGVGNGPISAFVAALADVGWKDFRLKHYSQHGMTTGSAAEAATYICLEHETEGKRSWGVSLDANVERGGLIAVISAFNRLRG